MKKISIVTPCYNEEENVLPLSEAVRKIFAEKLPGYTYEHLFIDNASTDGTVRILKEIAARDRNVKIIVNTRNFGHIRSPYHGLLQSNGDATLLLVADFQDPPDLIPMFIEHWEKGFKMVLGIKTSAEESAVMYSIRTAYYNLLARLSDLKLNKNSTGFGLYDRQVIETLKKIDDPYPYFRGLISDLGFEAFRIEYKQPTRRRGITKNNFYTLYDIAMLGITNHSKIPLRLAAMAGFVMSGISLLIALGYLVAKLVYWDKFDFFFSSVQLFFIGIIGEYIGAIFTQVQRRPLVIEKERIGFG
jgi:glycosyltransferase involved in cell wall biosynthesis